jgi:hypothetical protein
MFFSILCAFCAHFFALQCAVKRRFFAAKNPGYPGLRYRSGRERPLSPPAVDTRPSYPLRLGAFVFTPIRDGGKFL